MYHTFFITYKRTKVVKLLYMHAIFTLLLLSWAVSALSEPFQCLAHGILDRYGRLLFEQLFEYLLRGGLRES